MGYFPRGKMSLDTIMGSGAFRQGAAQRTRAHSEISEDFLVLQNAGDLLSLLHTSPETAAGKAL